MVTATPPDQLDDLKLDWLLGLIDKVAVSPDALQPALKPVAEAFVENFRRLQNQILLPASAVAFATRFQHYRCLATQEVKGKIVTVEVDDADHAKIGEIFTRLFRQNNLERTRKISEAGEGKPSSIIGQELKDGFHILGQLSKAQAPVMLSGAREQFASHITATGPYSRRSRGISGKPQLTDTHPVSPACMGRRVPAAVRAKESRYRFPR
jgi:hypothetical protein